MSISQNFPNTRPSLSINFARSQTLDPRITFTRTTSGTRVGPDGYIEVIPADQPRFDFDPVTGECLGLIIEEQRQNLISNSENFDTWTKPGTPAGASISQDVTSSPDGNNTADKIVETNTTGGHGIWIAVTLPSTTTYTFSVFLKAAERTWVDVRGYNSTNGNQFIAKIDLVNGVFLSNTIGTVRLDEYPNGWWRFSGMGDFGNIYTQFFIAPIISNNNTSDTSYEGDGSSGVYVWGSQLEKDKDASSYIPTSGSTVTRESDNVYMTDISDFFNPNEGTAIITYRPRFNGVYNTPFNRLFSFVSPAGRNIGFSGNANTGQLYFNDYNNLLSNDGGRFTWLNPPTPSTQRSERVLVSYANTYFRMYQNEIAFVSTNTLYGAGKISEYIPSAVGISTLGFNVLTFGSGSTSNTNSKFNHTLQQFIYYPNEVGVFNAKTLSKRP